MVVVVAAALVLVVLREYVEGGRVYFVSRCSWGLKTPSTGEMWNSTC